MPPQTLFLVFVVAGAAYGQTVTVRVVDRDTGRPLVNAELIQRDSDRSMLTDLEGIARVAVQPNSPRPLRVRQLGYRYVDTTLIVAGTSVAVVVALQRVAYALPSVFSIAEDACEISSDAEARLLTATALEQIRMSAERYNAFRRQFPFRARIERLTETFAEDGMVLRARRTTQRGTSDEWGDRYEPGRVVINTGLGFSVPTLHIGYLADPVFWDHHCMVAEPAIWGEQRAIRLHFQPSRKVSSPDWSGWVLLDSATSTLRRIEFKLVGLSERSRPYRFEGFTTFTSPTAYIVVPESSAAMWWRSSVRSRPNSWPDVLQVLHLKELTFRRKPPPSDSTLPH